MCVCVCVCAHIYVYKYILYGLIQNQTHSAKQRLVAQSKLTIAVNSRQS